MPRFSKRSEIRVLAAGLLCLELFLALPLLLPDPGVIHWNYLSKLRFAAGSFYGSSATDISQDIIGARGLVAGTNPYPVLGPALRDLGLDWDLDFRTPHPPTAFLFVFPIAFFSWPLASALWSALMIACWMFALKLLGLSWKLSVGVGGLLLLWPPASLSLGQLTPVWLLFLTLAFVYRTARPTLSGAAVALAAMSKWTPALALINFVRLEKRWRTAAGFAAAWGLALTAIQSFNSQILTRYLAASRDSTLKLILGPENASPLGLGLRWLGWPGALLWLAFLGWLVWRNWDAIRENSERGWMFSFYLAVAVLPVLWVYSLLPLLPVGWHLLRKASPVSRGLTLAAAALSFFGPGFGSGSVPFISGSVLLMGLALVNAREG